MQSSGFANAPLSKYLIVWVVASAIVATATDTKHYLYIQVVPHLWRYRQFWRLLTWPVCYTNSTEVLFASLTLYNLRVIERLWGSRKLASFFIGTVPYTVLLPPIILTLLRPLTGNNLNYLPAGPTSFVFALLAQYHAAIPYTYRYRIATSSSTSEDAGDEEPKGILLTSKSLSYLLPLQLALAQLPGSLIPAIVGWIVGYAWRADFLPFPSNRWRIPRALYSGGKGGAVGAQAEGLRRRLEDEASGRASGAEGGSEGRMRRR